MCCHLFIFKNVLSFKKKDNAFHLPSGKQKAIHFSNDPLLPPFQTDNPSAKEI